MNFTIEQKENITTMLSILYLRLYRGANLAGCIEDNKMVYSQSQTYARDIRESLESAVRYVDKLKQYLMEIDNGTTK